MAALSVAYDSEAMLTPPAVGNKHLDNRKSHLGTENWAWAPVQFVSGHRYTSPTGSTRFARTS